MVAREGRLMLHQTFILRTDDHAKRLYAFLKANWRAMAEQDKPLSVLVTEKRPKRTDEQNRLYWSRLGEIAEQAWIDGKRYSKDVWHEYYRAKFCPKIDAPHGKLIAMSTTDLTVEAFTLYMNEIAADAANYGVELSE